MRAAMEYVIRIVSAILIGAEIVSTCNAWECLCGRDECQWCNEEEEWNAYRAEAFEEYAAEFDAIFESLSVTSKRTDKGMRVTVRRPNGRIARSILVKVA